MVADAEPVIDGAHIKFLTGCFCCEEVQHQTHHEELRAEPHHDDIIEGRTRWEFEVVQGGEKQNGDRGKCECERDVFALLHVWRRVLEHHAVTHEGHVRHQEPRQEPLGVQHGPGQHNGAKHRQTGARLDFSSPSSGFGDSDQEDGEQHVKPRSTVRILGGQICRDAHPVGDEVRATEGEDGDVDDPRPSNL